MQKGNDPAAATHFVSMQNSNKNANQKSQDDNSFVASLIDSNANAHVAPARSNDRDVPMQEATPQPSIQNQEHDTSYSSTSSALLQCKCTKTHCLQLYCDCFHSGQLCSDQCTCVDCGNTSFNTTNRLQKMASVLKRNKNTFDEDASFDALVPVVSELRALYLMRMPSCLTI
jgi:hypothetical protein